MAKPEGSAYRTGYRQVAGLDFKVPYSYLGTQYGPEEEQAVLAAMRQEQLTNGPQVAQFEQEFASYAQVSHAFTTSNCTTALHLATMLLELGEGDEVITTPLTFVATSEHLLRHGCKVVFADVDERTFNIDPQSIREKITPKTRAIYLVHFGGQICEMDEIMKIANEHDLAVVEDCAHAAGATFDGKPAGSFGDFGCFSFHALKNMSTLGEGGMLTTNRDDLAQDVPRLRSMGVRYYYESEKHGQDPRDYWLPYHYDVTEVRGHIGNNYRMSDPQAAVGRVQLKRLEELNAARTRAAQYFTEKLSDLDGISTPWVDPRAKHSWHLYSLIIDPEKVGATRDEFLRVLTREAGVQVVIHYLPNYLFTLYKERGYEAGQCPVAEKVFNGLFNLPIHPRLTQEQLDLMVDGVRQAYETVRAGQHV